MTWSIELIRDGFCAGLGFWLAKSVYDVLECCIQIARLEIQNGMKRRELEKLKELKRQIDER